MRVRCGACRSNVTITRPGRFSCPKCGAVNQVKGAAPGADSDPSPGQGPPPPHQGPGPPGYPGMQTPGPPIPPASPARGSLPAGLLSGVFFQFHSVPGPDGHLSQLSGGGFSPGYGGLMDYRGLAGRSASTRPAAHRDSGASRTARLQLGMDQRVRRPGSFLHPGRMGGRHFPDPPGHRGAPGLSSLPDGGRGWAPPPFRLRRDPGGWCWESDPGIR